MAAPLVLLAAGGAISAYGAIKSNMDRADAERKNALYFQEQADYAQAIGDREMDVFRDKADLLRGQQIGGYAKGGVELTGSPLLFLEQQSIRKEREEQAIKKETERRVRLARLKGLDAEAAADNYSSFWTNFVSAAPSILSAAGSSYKAANGAR